MWANKEHNKTRDVPGQFYGDGRLCEAFKSRLPGTQMGLAVSHNIAAEEPGTRPQMPELHVRKSHLSVSSSRLQAVQGQFLAGSTERSSRLWSQDADNDCCRFHCMIHRRLTLIYRYAKPTVTSHVASKGLATMDKTTTKQLGWGVRTFWFQPTRGLTAKIRTSMSSSRSRTGEPRRKQTSEVVGLFPGGCRIMLDQGCWCCVALFI